MKRLIFAFALVFASAFSFAQNSIREYVEQIGAREPLHSAVWGIKAETMDGRVIIDYNSEQKMVPASNTKLLSVGTALHSLGPDFRFKTTLSYDGCVRDGVLYGDLYIQGGADPTIGSDDSCSYPVDTTFARWKAVVEKAGIKCITGKVIGDARYFDGPEVGSWWGVDDLGWDYGAPVTALSFNENRQTFRVSPGVSVGDAVAVEVVYPQTPWMSWSHSAVTTPAGCGDEIWYDSTDWVHKGAIRGGLAIDRKPKNEVCSNRFGALTCAYYFSEYLKEHGIAVVGGYSDSPQEVSLTEIGSSCSQPLGKIAWQANHISDNFYAEVMLRIQGRIATGSACYDSSYVALAEVFEDLKVDTSYGYRQKDGSGLARHNWVSPDFFVRYLKAMTKSPSFQSFFESIPQPGSYGTLDNRVPQADAATKARIHTKSGSMSGVRCYSGYIEAKDRSPQKMMVVSIMINNASVPQSEISKITDMLLYLLSQEN